MTQDSSFFTDSSKKNDLNTSNIKDTRFMKNTKRNVC